MKILDSSELNYFRPFPVSNSIIAYVFNAIATINQPEESSMPSES